MRSITVFLRVTVGNGLDSISKAGNQYNTVIYFISYILMLSRETLAQLKKFTLSTRRYDDPKSFFVGIVYAVMRKPRVNQTFYVQRTADVIVIKQKGAKTARAAFISANSTTKGDNRLCFDTCRLKQELKQNGSLEMTESVSLAVFLLP